MEVRVVAVGRPSHPDLASAIAGYEERAGRYFSLRVEEVPAAGAGGRDEEDVRRREAEALLGRVPEGLEVFALTRRGKGMTSTSLARYLERLGTYGRPGVAFLVGGAHGLAEEVREGADYRLSLSPFTLPHEIARLLLAEQLYRAGTILRGEPYHKGD